MLPQPPELDLTEDDLAQHQAHLMQRPPEWLTLLLHLFPGIFAVFLILSPFFYMIYHKAERLPQPIDLIYTVMILPQLIVIFAAGMFRARLQPEYGRYPKEQRLGYLCWQAGLFLALQLIITPLVCASILGFLFLILSR